MRKKRTIHINPSSEYGEDEGWSTELSSLSEASSGDDWVPPKTMRKKKPRVKHIRSGKLRPNSSDDDDSSSDSSSIISLSNSKPKLSTSSFIKNIQAPVKSDSSSIISSSNSKPKLSTSAFTENIQGPVKRKAQNDGNGHISKLLPKENIKNIVSNNEKKKPNAHGTGLIITNSPGGKITDGPKEKPNQPNITKSPGEKITDGLKKKPNQPNASPDIIYKNGDFFIRKSDVADKKNSPLWRVDGKSLLQRYCAIKKDGKDLHKNTSSYVGYCNLNHQDYIKVKIRSIMLNNKEHMVEVIEDESG